MEASEPVADLEEALRRAWILLQRGAEGSAADMRTLVLATRGLDERPNARTVVLWRVAPERHALYFNTDARSPKYAELTREPHATLVFYDEKAETQLRIRAEIQLHRDDALAREGWDELPAHMRRLFMTETAPGHAAPGPTPGVPENWLRSDPPPEAQAAGFRNFVVVEAVMRHLDWLYFSRAGHRRAGFSWTDNGPPRATWLYP